MSIINRNAKRQELQAALSSLRNSGSSPYTLASILVVPPILSAPKAAQEPAAAANNNSSNNSNDNNNYKIQDASGADWTRVANLWLDACEFAAAGYAERSYECQASLHTAFNQLFAASAGNVLVPTLHAVCKTTHRLAMAADKEVSSATSKATSSSDNAKLQNAVTLLQESFSRTFNDRRELQMPGHPDEPPILDAVEGSKKAGVLQIVNELFSIYFTLNTLRLCKNLLRPVESRKLHLHGTKAEMVTYRYYTGRLNLFEDLYPEADANLVYALDHCHYAAIANKRRILRYLVPVRLYRGRLPSAALLEKYELYEFVPLVESMRKGDLRTFNDTLVRYQDRFIRQGTYLLLEKCKTVCYRNMIKRIHLVVNKPQLPLGVIAHAFKWLGMPIDLDEVECLLANLIYRNYVKGYLSHTKRMLVLSKRDPFPVSSVIAK